MGNGADSGGEDKRGSNAAKDGKRKEEMPVFCPIVSATRAVNCG